MDDDKIPSRSRWNPNAAATIRWHGYKSISIVISSDTPKAREAAEAGQALTHFQLPPTKNLPDPAMAGAAEAELLRGSSRGRRRAAEARGAGDAGGAREGPRRRNHSLSRCCGWWEEGEGEARV